MTETVMTEAKLVSLAREIAIGILPLPTILDGLKLSLADLETVSRYPRFQQLVESMAAEWGSTLNTPERVKVKSQALIEDTLPELYTLIHEKKESMAAKVEALKLLRVLGGMGERDPGSGIAPERFHLEIHIGESRPRVIDVTPGVTPGPHNLRRDPVIEYSHSLNDGELAGGCDD